MSDKATKKMLAMYMSQASPTAFFTGMFQSRFFNTQEVEIDIMRTEEDVAIVIGDISTGYNMNAADIYTNKGFIAPIFKEAATINAFDLLNREAGNDPFSNVSFQANATSRALKSAQKIESKIRRSIELQASQVMQTGIVSLVDSAGNVLFTLDYKPKATHFPTAGTAWNAGGATIAADISALAEVIRTDGLSDVDELVMGVEAYEAFISDADIKSRLDNRRMEQGRINPMQKRGNGGIFRGTVEIGNYSYNIFTYGGRYKHPQTGVVTQFLDPAKVILRDSNARMDAAFGAIPRVVAPDSRVLKYLPSRISNGAGNIDMFVNAWVTADGENLNVGVGSRPLMIPVAIDTYGCIATGV